MTNAVLYVRPSVRHTRDPRSRYELTKRFAPHDRAMFLVSWAKFRDREFRDSFGTNVLKRCTPPR